MAELATNRVWASLSDSEAAAVERAAAARGVRASEVVRDAILTFLGRPVSVPVADTAPPVLARLDALAGTLGRHVAELGRLVPATDEAFSERDEVRASLQDIAACVGVLAGSLEPDGGGEGAFGPDRD
jgi:hypothetical protein